MTAVDPRLTRRHLERVAKQAQRAANDDSFDDLPTRSKVIAAAKVVALAYALLAVVAGATWIVFA